MPATEEHSTERNRSPDACSNCYQSTTAVRVPIPVHMQLAGYNEITARYFNHINNGENFIVPYSVDRINEIQQTGSRYLRPHALSQTNFN